MRQKISRLAFSLIALLALGLLFVGPMMNSVSAQDADDDYEWIDAGNDLVVAVEEQSFPVDVEEYLLDNVIGINVGEVLAIGSNCTDQNDGGTCDAIYYQISDNQFVHIDELVDQSEGGNTSNDGIMIINVSGGSAQGFGDGMPGSEPTDPVDLTISGDRNSPRIMINNPDIIEYDGLDPDADEGDGPDTGEGNDEDADQGTCEDKGGDFGWVMCPIIRAADAGITTIDGYINRLLSVDRDYYDNDGIKGAWSNIRNLAYVILIPLILVMVIGTALGFEIISAYSVKKALPKLVGAVLFISLSYTICVAVIEITNGIGRGTLSLITAPFLEPGQTELSLDALFARQGIAEKIIGQRAIVIGVIILASFFLGTLLMLAATAFLVLLLRQIFVVVLLLMSPLALFEDKTRKFWWGSFWKLLMMYPIIMAVIGIGRVFAFVIMKVDPAGLQGNLQPLMAITAYILPYAFIPFTFKLAGGLFSTFTGMVNDRQKGLFDRSRQKRAAKFERGIGRSMLARRANTAGKVQEWGSGGGWARRRVGSFAGKKLGGYNVEAAMSARQAQVAKEVNDQIATGRDDDVRGLTVNKDLLKDFDGAQAQGLARMEGGRRQYKSLGGGWVDEANVRAGHERWGKDRFAQQAALSYEMRKAMNDEQVQGISDRYQGVAGSWGMTGRQAGGAWIGAAFENQNQHLEYKHTRFDAQGAPQLNHASFAEEAWEKRGSYPLSQMSAHTIEQLETAYNAPVSAYKATETMTAEQVREQTRNRIREVADTFEMRGGGVMGMEGEVPLPAEAPPPVPGAQREPVVSAPGAGHVQQAARSLYNTTRLPGGPAP